MPNGLRIGSRYAINHHASVISYFPRITGYNIIICLNKSIPVRATTASQKCLFNLLLAAKRSLEKRMSKRYFQRAFCL